MRRRVVLRDEYRVRRRCHRRVFVGRPLPRGDHLGDPRRQGGYGRPRNPLRNWSGRPDSNRRRPAWEAGILPLNYGRPALPILLPTVPPLLPVLERHVVGLDELVAARLPVETLGRAVEVELLV